MMLALCLYIDESEKGLRIESLMNAGNWGMQGHIEAAWPGDTETAVLLLYYTFEMLPLMKTASAHVVAVISSTMSLLGDRTCGALVFGNGD